MLPANSLRAPSAPRSRRGVRRGFTLIEVMVSVAVFMVGLVGIIAMDVAANGYMQRAARLERATSIANSIIGLTTVLPETTLIGMASGTITYYDHDGVTVNGDRFYQATTTVAAQVTADKPVYNTAVVVTWTEPVSKQVRQVTLQTTVSAS